MGMRSYVTIHREHNKLGVLVKGEAVLAGPSGHSEIQRYSLCVMRGTGHEGLLASFFFMTLLALANKQRL